MGSIDKLADELRSRERYLRVVANDYDKFISQLRKEQREVILETNEISAALLKLDRPSLIKRVG